MTIDTCTGRESRGMVNSEGRQEVFPVASSNPIKLFLFTIVFATSRILRVPREGGGGTASWKTGNP